MLTRVYRDAKPRRSIDHRRTIAAVLAGLVLFTGQWPDVLHAAPHEEALKNYLAAVYARDYPAAYEWISREDRKVKSREEYARENGTFTGVALEIARALGSHIQFEQLRTEIEGGRATVTGTIILPNANDPVIQDLFLEFDEERLASRPPAERRARIDRLGEMARSGRLPVIVGENEQWVLIREHESWRIYLNWAGAVMVRFEARVEAGLPWEFEPVQPTVRAKPGETLHTSYRIRSLSRGRVTGKARHVLYPPEETGHLQIVTCFCFLQQTLDPGEEQELPVVFRVNYEIPDSITELVVRYEFYPLDRFPEGRPGEQP